MADKLTEHQDMAVRNRGGRLLVSAAAGSGKTRVLVERLMNYLTDPQSPANLDEFLIITYTRAAAGELRGKIAEKLTERIAREPENRHLQQQLQRLFLTQISTVHSFCAAVLKEYAYRIDLSPDFRVADESECAELRTAAMKEILDSAYAGQTGHFRDFVDSQGVGRDDNAIPEIIQKVYDSARCHLDPRQWLEGCLTHVELEGVTDAAQSVWGEYLVQQLFVWLDLQIRALSRCHARMEQSRGMEKPAAVILQLIDRLKFLRASQTWDQVHARIPIDFGRLTFSKKIEDAALAEQVKAIRNACRTGLEQRSKWFVSDSRQVLEDLRASAGAAQGILSLVEQFGQAFSRLKRSRRILDYGDLEHCTLDLLLGKRRSELTAAAREIGLRYREIMVDEYQDSNAVQDAIFTALTRQKQNCFMVGDVKQSIYGFRLADPRIFLEKYMSYAPAEAAQPGQGRKIMLSDNFRSGGEVISGVNDVFRACMSPQVGGLTYGQSEALREGTPHIALEDGAMEFHVLEVTDGDSYEKEAAFAAGQIRTMLSSGAGVRSGDSLRPVAPEDIVILLRSPGSMAQPFRDALEAEGIRCALDGGTRLLDTPEVSTLIALLQTVSNPRQDIPLLAVLASPVFGFTADDLAKFRASCRRGSIYDALRSAPGEKTRYFLDTLDALRRKARLEPLTRLLQSCFTLTRMDSIYGAMPGGKARKENLQTFFRLAVEYESSSLRTLSQFLEHLQSLDGGQLSAAGSSAGCVTIMSIHKSKGLEFPVVFLCGLSHGFNRSDQQERVLCSKELGLGLSVVDNVNRVRYSAVSRQAIAAAIKSESTSEELRVLYVAMTRARDRLIMTCTLKNPQKKLTELANRLIPGGEVLVNMEAGCPADWVLCAALSRVEAGALHAVGGRPEQLNTGGCPWKITLTEASPAPPRGCADGQEDSPFPEETVDALRAGLSFRYGHMEATRAPSKQTATGRKGRELDEEVQENAPHSPEPRSWRKPSLPRPHGSAAARGSAVHSAMQFIRYEACTDASSVSRELARLTEAGLLTAQQASMVNPGQLSAFFATPIGKKLVSGTRHIREFKFSILDDGEKYGTALEGEQVLLQGVVDCALLEPDGITVLDFKTDRVTEQTLPQAVARYRLQLETYAQALARIFRQPVREKCLYFFHLNRFVPL